MKIELDSRMAGKNMIESYSAEGIRVRDRRYEGSLIVSPDRVIENWQPRTLAELELGHFRDVIDMAPEIVLIGTGARLMFPDEALLEPMVRAGIGVDIMDTGAACRAYNFIAAEGRIVVAALLKIED